MFVGIDADLCQKAWRMIWPAVQEAADLKVTNKLAGTIVVMAPGDETAVFVQMIGEDPDPKYTEIAFAKADISVRTGMPSSIVQQQFPYLYQEGDTKWGGSTVLPGGVVVAFSGVQAVFDEMISEWMASAIRALCRHEMTRPDGGVMLADYSFIGGKW